MFQSANNCNNWDIVFIDLFEFIRRAEGGQPYAQDGARYNSVKVGAEKMLNAVDP